MSDETRIIINYAYDGFLYAPIFLAEEFALSPDSYKFACSHGDAEVIDKLCSSPALKEKHWFGIGDPHPLSDHLQRIAPHGYEERICLVGGIVNKAPVWLYNTNPKIRRLNSEAELHSHLDKVTKIVTYPQGTTGHLFGERITRKYFPEAQVIAKPFGQEFDSVDDETLVVTPIVA